MRHPSIEATIKVNDWARVGTACMSSHQSMTLQGKRFRQKRRSTPATPRCRMTRSQASKDEIGTTVQSTLPQYAHKQTKFSVRHTCSFKATSCIMERYFSLKGALRAPIGVGPPSCMLSMNPWLQKPKQIREQHPVQQSTCWMCMLNLHTNTHINN